jgi:hypothetical protein
MFDEACLPKVQLPWGGPAEVVLTRPNRKGEG